MGLNRISALVLVAGAIAIAIAIAILFGPAWGLLAAGVGAIILALEDRHVRSS